MLEINDFEALWLTLYGEARGEPIESQIGVANVIRNRKEETGKNYAKICLEPLQFSCWNENDPNRKILEGLIEKDFHNTLIEDKIIKQLKHIAEGIINYSIVDNTKGSNHYLEIILYRNNPPLWAKEATYNTFLGHHVFLWCK